MGCDGSIPENEGVREKEYRMEKLNKESERITNGRFGKDNVIALATAALVLALLLCAVSGCGAKETTDAQAEMEETEEKTGKTKGEETSAAQEEDTPGGSGHKDLAADNTEPASLIDPEGMTLESRVKTPESYTRKPAASDSLCAFLRGYALKEDGSPVLLYNGKKKRNQDAHQAVFALPIEAEDLQQCADSIMRVYAEYFRETGQEEKIGFHFVSGFYAEYARWRDGYRIKVDGNDVAWTKSAGYDDSYESFQKYLRVVFSYAGTLSMEAEAEEIPLSDIACGDVFLKGGSPGHVVLVADVCENEDGQKAFLLAQGFMPAQEFHLLKNPLHEDDPWYYDREMEYPFITPEYTFPEGSLKRLDYDSHTH